NPYLSFAVPELVHTPQRRNLIRFRLYFFVGFGGFHLVMDGLIVTMPPSQPGTAPLIRTIFFCASTFTTVRCVVVAVSLPICPGIITPLKTRPGVVPAPIEPMERWNFEPWLIGPRPAWKRLIVP